MFRGFQSILSSHSGQPSNSAFGAQVTCYQNALTAFTSVMAGSLVTKPAKAILLRLTDGATSGQAKDTIVQLGIDRAGGSNFVAFGDPLLVGPAGQYNAGGTKTLIQLPIEWPQGASLGLVGSVNNASPGTLRASCKLFCDPIGPVFSGQTLEAVGLVAASSCGTAVTPGQASDGAWTLLGSLPNGGQAFGVGASIGAATMGSLIYHLDLGYSTDGGQNVVPLVEDQMLVESSVESVAFDALWTGAHLREVPRDAKLYARAQCAGAPTSGFTMAAWVVR